MKVMREPVKPVFRPISIILESKEEADLMWHLLNRGKGENTHLAEYFSRHNFKYDSTKEYIMWSSLNDVYDPADK
jgi:hypothetical protein